MINIKDTIKGSPKSKTMWFNTIVGALIAAEASISLLQPVLGAEAYGITSFVLVVGNVLLRAITNKSLGDK